MSNEMNIMKMNVGTMINLMTPLYAKASPIDIPSLMLWGPPGIGKSQAFRGIAKKLEEITGKIINIIDVRLLLFNPVDLRGIPSPYETEVVQPDGSIVKEKLAKWLKPQLFQMDPSSDVINILILDEISAAPLSVQAAAYQITLDRIIGEHKLPDNCIVVAAGNRVTDKSVSYKMPKALGNRMTHIEIGCDVDDWKKWAIPFGIDHRIIGFINWRNTSLFDFDPNNDNVAYPTPRSWEMVDKYLKQFDNINTCFPLIAGSIGLGAATEFKAYSKVFHKLPNIQAIFDGTETSVPEGPDVLYALSAALSSRVSKVLEEKESVRRSQLANLIKYTINMPAEFATLTIKDIVVIDKARNEMLRIPEWIEWCKKYHTFIM